MAQAIGHERNEGMKMYKGLNLRFEYAIRFENGKYYTGRAGDSFAGSIGEAFTYTESGAYSKIERMKDTINYWKNATVEKVI